MENEPLVGSNNFLKYQYAWKQGLNLSSSLGLEVREETSFDWPKRKYLKVELKKYLIGTVKIILTTLPIWEPLISYPALPYPYRLEGKALI